MQSLLLKYFLKDLLEYIKCMSASEVLIYAMNYWSEYKLQLADVI